MCGIFSKEVLSKHVDVNTASLPSLILVPHAVMCQFIYVMPAGEENNLRNFSNGKDKGQVKWFNESKGFGFITPAVAAKTCSYTSPLSRVMASKLG